MPTPGQLVKMLSGLTGVPHSAFKWADRVLADNGHRTPGGRGFAAAKVTERDAVLVLLGGTLTEPGSNVCDVALSYDSLPTEGGSWDDPYHRDIPDVLRPLLELGEDPTFGASLAKLIQLTPEPLQFKGHPVCLRIKIEYPGREASIEIDHPEFNQLRSFGFDDVNSERMYRREAIFTEGLIYKIGAFMKGRNDYSFDPLSVVSSSRWPKGPNDPPEPYDPTDPLASPDRGDA